MTNSYCSKMNIKVSEFFIYLCVMVGLTMGSCSKKSSEGRPSPLAIDSVQLSAAKLSIVYSSPGVKERKIWGYLVPFGNIWRTGANEATIFNTSEEIQIEGHVLPAGKYSLFTIPNSNKWTIIFNNDWDQWGAYNYDSTKNALTLEVIPETTKNYQERMKFYFKENQLIFHWEYLRFVLDIES